MFVKLCQHRKEDGKLCRSPALRGQNYCHFHIRYKGYPLRTWPNRRRLGGWHFTRAMALDLKAAEAMLKRVERALFSGRCSDPRRARVIRYGLQGMVSDLRYQRDEAALGDSTLDPARVPGEQ